jgi:hypothetical protein
VRQAHQLVGAVLKFAVKAKHLPASPADGVELPRLPEAEQRYLTHEQLHQVAVAAGRLRTLVLVLGYSAGRPFSDFALTPSSRYSSTMVSPLRSAWTTFARRAEQGVKQFWADDVSNLQGTNKDMV